MKISKELLKGSTGTMVLGLLAEEDLYGYAIIREIEERSQSVFRMSEGSLYPILHAMEKEGLIGKLHRYFYSTVGNGTAVKSSKAFAAEYAQKFVAAGVDAVIMTST